MPIIELVPDNAPLTQGDILKGVRLFSTARSWENDGGEAAQKDDGYCLVVSRPCVLEHKDSAVVVRIKASGLRIPKDSPDFDQAMQFLKDTRDGVDTPDLFYLGQLSGEPKLYVACLDSFHDIEIPQDAGERAEFVRARRVARLHEDFRRDLHVRIFRAFASLGFDDVGWFSDSDLQWVIATAEQDIRTLQSQIHEIQNEKLRCEQRGGSLSTNKSKELAGKQKRLAEIERKRDELKAEQTKRFGGTPNDQSTGS